MTGPTVTAGPVKRRDWWTLTGIAIVAVGAIVASFTAQAGLGDLAGWHASLDVFGVAVRLSWLLPLCVDAYGVTATRIAVNSDRYSDHTRHHALIHAVGAVVVSIVANAIYHALQAKVLGLGELRWVLVVAVSMIPPVALGALAHLMALCARDDAHTPNGGTGEQVPVHPEPVEPQPVRLETVRPTAVAARTPIARTSVVELSAVGAGRTRTRSETADRARVDRAALLSELVRQIRHTESDGGTWTPDYPALEARTGYRRSWCQKVVREARTLAAGDDRSIAEALITTVYPNFRDHDAPETAGRDAVPPEPGTDTDPPRTQIEPTPVSVHGGER